ncbi:MAG: CPBP family intramembrane metalloprotease [Lachnospiraceae bacterium]|nr:CPBP family intramembrane metalloprotease [Lachnospiraceae bacterium]
MFLSNKNTKGALLAGTGFLVFFLYYLILVFSGWGEITGLTLGVFFTKVILQQITTGFYEELNYRFLLLEGLKSTKNDTVTKVVGVLISSILFGLLHCIGGWNTYTFLQTGAIGFAFAVIFVKSGNILIPMILHFVYDFFAKTVAYMNWKHTAVFDGLNSVFEIMLAAMFVISAVILILPCNGLRAREQ